MQVLILDVQCYNARIRDLLHSVGDSRSRGVGWEGVWLAGWIGDTLVPDG